MKFIGRSILVVLFVIIVNACSSNTNRLNNTVELNKILYDSLIAKTINGVDIWSSINYEIITDLETIKEIDISTTEGAILINLVINLENKGQHKAESFKFTFEAPVPIRYISGFERQGIDKDFLDKGDKYEYYCYYIFRDHNDLSDFINHSIIKVEWKEKDADNQKLLKLPLLPAS